MIVRYNGKGDVSRVIKGKEYEVISVEDDWYRIVDETGEDFLYPSVRFEIVEE